LYRASEVDGNSLTKSREGIANFFKQYIFAIGLPIPYDPLPEGIDYPPEQSSEGVIEPLEIFARGLSHKQRKRQPFCNTSKEPKK
jgi:hypothetical protein